tara:strand:+ start:467 stop:847 length:381 start_codon:yes stop_codon:yes gene_type:complete
MVKKLSLKRELFCIKYMENRGNGTRAYCDAYDLDYHNPKDLSNAKSRASELVNTSEIVIRIRELLDETGLNDVMVSNELKHLIWQDEDRGAKAKGIDMYHRIARMYDEKIEIQIKDYKAKFNMGDE